MVFYDFYYTGFRAKLQETLLINRKNRAILNAEYDRKENGEKNMTVLIMDGQGGNIGRQLVKSVCERFSDLEVIAVGSNSIATANMLKGGSVSVATGENAACVAARRADVIIGPLGIVVADALLGEITPKMTAAVGQSGAVRILIPMNKCDSLVAGVQNLSTAALLEDAMQKLETVISARA